MATPRRLIVSSAIRYLSLASAPSLKAHRPIERLGVRSFVSVDNVPLVSVTTTLRLPVRPCPSVPPNYYADPQVHLIAARQSDGSVQSAQDYQKDAIYRTVVDLADQTQALAPLSIRRVATSYSLRPFIPLSCCSRCLRNFPQGEPKFPRHGVAMPETCDRKFRRVIAAK